MHTHDLGVYMSVAFRVPVEIMHEIIAEGYDRKGMLLRGTSAIWAPRTVNCTRKGREMIYVRLEQN